MQKNDIHSLSHTKWECKYHIVFAPKYRRKVFLGQSELCRWKGVSLLEAEACPDHIHILIESLFGGDSVPNWHPIGFWLFILSIILTLI